MDMIARLRRTQIYAWAEGLQLHTDPSDRRIRMALLVVTGVIAVLAAYNFAVVIPRALHLGVPIGVDLHTYEGVTRTWLATGQFYPSWQLSGPYVLSGESQPILYPPLALYLFLPFLVVPEPLWWLIPIGILAAVIWRLRPRVWTWPILALILWLPRTLEILIYGNPSLWVAAFVGAGLLIPGMAVLVLIKPSLAPFALIRFGRRGWWLAAAVVVIAALPLGRLWLDYLAVIAYSNGPLTYSLSDAPFVALPVVAYVGRKRPQA